MEFYVEEHCLNDREIEASATDAGMEFHTGATLTKKLCLRVSFFAPEHLNLKEWFVLVHEWAG